MDGFYFFKYGNKDVCERVLHEGPWLFDERPYYIEEMGEFRIGDRPIVLCCCVGEISIPPLEVLVSKNLEQGNKYYWEAPIYGQCNCNLGEICVCTLLYRDSATSKLPQMVCLELEGG